MEKPDSKRKPLSSTATCLWGVYNVTRFISQPYSLLIGLLPLLLCNCNEQPKAAKNWSSSLIITMYANSISEIFSWIFCRPLKGNHKQTTGPKSIFNKCSQFLVQWYKEGIFLYIVLVGVFLKNIYLFTLCVWMVCLCVCVHEPCEFLEPSEVRRGSQIP